MKTAVKISLESNLNPNLIWDTLKNGDNVQKWLPFIVSCELQGKGEGAKRICKTDNGENIIETILTIDHDNKTFIYGIDSHDMEFPTKDIIGTMKVENNNDITTTTWKIEYNYTSELDLNTKHEIEDGIKNMMTLGLEGLNNLNYN